MSNILNDLLLELLQIYWAQYITIIKYRTHLNSLVSSKLFVCVACVRYNICRLYYFLNFSSMLLKICCISIMYVVNLKIHIWVLLDQLLNRNVGKVSIFFYFVKFLSSKTNKDSFNHRKTLLSCQSQENNHKSNQSRYLATKTQLLFNSFLSNIGTFILR